MNMMLTAEARLGLLIAVCGGLWCFESLFPLFRNYAGRERLRHNLTLAVLVVGVNLMLATSLALFATWVTEHRVGLLGNFRVSDWFTLSVGLAGLDLTIYVAHVLLHKMQVGWAFHRVHHSDRQVDVTTTLRQHPGETFWRIGWQVAGTAVLGIPFWIVVVYTTLSSLNALFEHANIRIARPADRVLRWVVVTPDMHKVHHSREVSQTDSNYGNILSLWDRLFRTYRPDNLSRPEYGIDGLDGPRDQTLSALLAMPFRLWRRQRA